MGLNIGVRVKQQPEGFMQFGCNPKGTLEEIGDRLQAHLESRLGPGFGVDVRLRDGWYTFDCRVGSYGRYMSEGSTVHDLQRELLVWVWEQFSDEEGVEMRTYHAA